MFRLWKLFRIILWAGLAWFVLALAWAFLPFPSSEREGDNGTDYATAVLRAGNTLTRVYDGHNIFHVDSNQRSAFALDYTLDTDSLALWISGSKKPIPIFNHNLRLAESLEHVDVEMRTGDTDGANLPWFDFADAVLLYWWLDGGTINVPLMVHRYEEEGGIYKLDLEIPNSLSDPLLSVQMRGNDSSTITATVPSRPSSASPSMTYPIRIVLIHVIAPTAIFVSVAFGIFFDAFGGIFVVAVYGFVIAAIIVSFWRCIGGPSLEDTVERVQGRIESWKENERLRLLPLDALQDRLDQLYRNERMKSFLYVCANGWHPEREAARAAEQEQTDIETGDVEKGDADKA